MGPLAFLLLAGGLLAAGSAAKSYPKPEPEPEPEPAPDLDEQALLDGLDDSLVSLGRAFIADVLQPLAEDIADDGVGLKVDRIDVDEDGIGLVAVIPCTNPRLVVEYIEALDLPIDEYRVIPAVGELHLVYGSAEMEQAEADDDDEAEDEDEDDTEEAAS